MTSTYSFEKWGFLGQTKHLHISTLYTLRLEKNRLFVCLNFTYSLIWSLYWLCKPIILHDLNYFSSILLRRAYTMKFFFHRWLNFSFDSFLSTFNTLYSCEMWMKFFDLQSWKYFRIKIFYQISDKNFFSWNTFHESKIKYLLKMT